MTAVATGDLEKGAPNYPLGILRGCAAIDECAVFRDLPDGFIRVVLRLVKKINLMKPESPIFARRETLAREAGKSVETVGRALRWLETAGLIQRNQKARPGLRGSEAHIFPTPRLIQALGIGERARPPVNTDGSVSALPKEQSLQKQSPGEPSAETKLSTPQAAAAPAPVKLQGKTIPRDLAWLATDGGLNATGVLRLMKLAREAGKRLSDVVAVTKAHLKTLAGKSLFAYIRSLLKQDKDFAFLNKRSHDQGEKDAKQRRDRELVARKALEWQGRRFKARDGRIITIESNGCFRQFDGKIERVGRIDIGLVEAIMEGKLTIHSSEGNRF